ncbi:MAG: VOC family protein [Acidobacteria bacterium]|nr:VOC family protein [Acidobacteriota bacterium]
MKITQASPIFRIFDEFRAREFYLDFLGFEIQFEHRFEPNMPLYMGIRLGDFILHLSEHAGDATPVSGVYIEMTGLDEYQKTLAAKNYKYCRPEIAESGYGTRLMKIIDPFHNWLSFNERIDGKNL